MSTSSRCHRSRRRSSSCVLNAFGCGSSLRGQPQRVPTGYLQANHWPARHHWPPWANHKRSPWCCLHTITHSIFYLHLQLLRRLSCLRSRNHLHNGVQHSLTSTTVDCFSSCQSTAAPPSNTFAELRNRHNNSPLSLSFSRPLIPARSPNRVACCYGCRPFLLRIKPANF